MPGSPSSLAAAAQQPRSRWTLRCHCHLMIHERGGAMRESSWPQHAGPHGQHGPRLLLAQQPAAPHPHSESVLHPPTESEEKW